MQILVLGMHRSGTSVLTQVVHQLGANVGEIETERGHFEQGPVKDVDDALLLASCGAHWYDADPAEIAGRVDGVDPQLWTRLRAIVDTMDRLGRPWVLKDPRMCVTIPWWRACLSNPLYVLSYRDPLEVALSLQKRDSMPIELGLALWERSMASALHHTSGQRRVLVRYADLLARPAEAVTELRDKLVAAGVTGLRPLEEALANLPIDLTRWRQRAAEPMRALHPLSPDQEALARALAAGEMPEVAVLKERSELERTSFRVYSFVQAERQKLRELEREMRLLQRTIAGHDAKLAAEQDRRRVVQEEARALRSQVRGKDREIARILSQVQSQRDLLQQNRADLDELSEDLDRVERAYRRMARSPLFQIGLAVESLRKRTSGKDKRLPRTHLRRIVRDHRRRLERVEKGRARIDDALRVFAGRAPTESEGVSESGGATPVLPEPRADVVVCVHDSPEYVERCLLALERHTNLRQHRIVLVDDGSAEPTQRLLARFVERLGAIHVRHETARGYTCAANAGLRRSSAPYVVLLNSDTEVTPGWLEALIACAVSAPRIGCVGPLSNAASWQSVPRMQDESGGWMVNELPEGVTLEEYALRLRVGSARILPRVHFVNGFCFLITRRALDEVGLLDEETFPTGYAEEDDFAIRAAQAGFEHRIADDCYVFHAKSKSFTPERRKAIVEVAKEKIRAKHGAEELQRRVKETQRNEDLLRVRVHTRLELERGPRAELPRVAPMTLGWLLPNLEASSAVQRALRIGNRLVGEGHAVEFLSPSATPPEWAPCLGRLRTVEAAAATAFDVLVVSDRGLLEPFRALSAKRKVIDHAGPAPIATDREFLHLASSQWLAAQLRPQVEIAAVVPDGIDPRVLRPLRHTDESEFALLFPERGTAADPPRLEGRSVLEVTGDDLVRGEFAARLSGVRAAVCFGAPAGFDARPLAAMACGVPVVVIGESSARDYTVHEENALCVPAGDEPALQDGLDRVLRDHSLRARLLERGLETARAFDGDLAVRRFVERIAEAPKSRAAGAG